MAQKSGGCLGSLLKVILAIIVVLVIVVVIVGLQPLATVGNWVCGITIGGTDLSFLKDLSEDSAIPYVDGLTFGDLDIDPQTTSVFDVVKLVTSIAKGLDVSEEDIISTPVSEEDTAAAKQKVDSLLPVISVNDEDSADYLSLLGNVPVVTDTAQQLEFEGNEIAALFNLMVGQASANGNGAASILKTINAEIGEIEFTETDGNKYVTIIVSVDITSVKDDLSESLPAFILNNLGDTLYITYVGELAVNDYGVLSTESVSFIINKFSEQQSNLVLTAVGSTFNLNNEDDNMTEYISDAVGEAFSTVINNLGSVGTLTDDTAVYGEAAIDTANNKIKLVTHTQD